MGLIQATAEYARWNKVCTNWAGPRVHSPAPGSFPAELWASRPQFLVYEAKAEDKKTTRPVMAAGVWALKLSLHTAFPLPSPADTRAVLCSSYQDVGELMALVAG